MRSRRTTLRGALRLLPLLILGLSPRLASQAPAAAVPAAVATEEAVARCVEALGGAAAWRRIETMELAGSHTSFHHTEPFLLRRKRPDLYRFDHNESTFPLTVAYDGRSAWWLTGQPLFSNANWPVEMPRPYQATVPTEAELDPPFVDYRDKGHEIEWVGESRFEGETYLELQVTRRQQPDAAERWFLDPVLWLPVLRLSRGAYHGYYTEQLTYFMDYREVEGVLIPHRVETELGNDFLELEVASVRLNHEIDDRVFARPLPAGMERLASLAGRWRVEIESLDDPAVHTERIKGWEQDETVSVIASRAGGSLLEEDIDVATDRPRRARRLYSFDRFRDVFRIAHFDTFTAHLDVLEGRRTEDGRIVLSDLETGTATMVYGQSLHVRETLHDVEADSFRLDREVSRNGGESWLPSIRFTYTRIADDDG